MEVQLCSVKPAVPVHVIESRPSFNDEKTDLPELTSIGVLMTCIKLPDPILVQVVEVVVLVVAD